MSHGMNKLNLSKSRKIIKQNDDNKAIRNSYNTIGVIKSSENAYVNSF